MIKHKLIVFIMLLALSIGAAAQTQSDSGTRKPKPHSPQKSYPATIAPKGLARNILQDQKDIWTGPFKARVEDLNWIVPAIGLTAGAINADAELSSRIKTTGTLAKNSGNLSNAGLGLAVGGSGALWLIGRWRADDKMQETGILGGEAALNSFVVGEVFKVVTRRERPSEGTGQGRFFHGTIANSAFPSAHSLLTWSIASVVAHEYPGPFTKVLAYGLAAGVGVARVTGRDHFPSDVIAGSAMGWLIGRQVYSRHQDADPTAGNYGTFVKDVPPETNKSSSDSVFSNYVPIDSWVYPAFERLAALGAVPSGFLGMRPWTRRECARLLEESAEYIDASSNDEASRLVSALQREFAVELGGTETSYVGVDSVYARVMSIAGPPLTDGYHFNKTIPYDYGRPYERGLNFISGYSSSGSAGPLGFYVRGEFDHAPSAPGVSQAVQNQLQIADSKPVVQPATPIAAFNRFHLIEAYVSLNIKGWQTSFGKQSLWLGPTRDPFSFSNNADPLYMFRVDQTTPRKLPGFGGLLGPYRIEFFFGQVSGHHYINAVNDGPFSVGRSLSKQPMMHAEKISFKPTPNFEFGVSVSTMWGGPGVPITLAEVRRTLTTFTNPSGGAFSVDPGDRNSYFNWSYRIPGLRKYLMIYEDSFSEDEISPIGYPRRSAQNPGIYLTQLPKLPHLDFRFEGGYTDLPNLIQPPAGGFYYWNIGYLDGHTNKGNIMGSTIGRQGLSFRAATTYWLASDKTIQLSCRNMQTNKFLQGGNLRDVQLRSDWSFKPSLSISSFVQYEWWNFPLLTAGKKQNNLTASLQLTYWPHWRFKGQY
ncbi:MAG TPA: capsule assembly Wzi family protein [Candidatus Angelobacter sp.]|jgi:hypothetical protein|nr:capsule assembly Wzi family protein [Candidatus Angelobacter sp.]